MKEFVFEPPRIVDFDEIKNVLLEVADDTAQGKSVVLACEELFVNIASYSGASYVRVSVEAAEAEIVASFCDDGIPFDPTTYHKEKDFFDFSEGGMGISMAKSIARDMSYERIEGQNRLTMTFGRRKDA